MKPTMISSRLTSLLHLGLALAAMGAAVASNSVILLAEAVRSFGRAGSGTMFPTAGDGASDAAGSARRVSALFMTAMVFAVCGGITLVAGFVRLGHPVPLTSPGIALAVLTASVAVGTARWRKGGSRFPFSAREPVLAVFAASCGWCCAVAAFAWGPRWDAAGAVIGGLSMMATAMVNGGDIGRLMRGGQSAPDDIESIMTKEIA